MIKRAGLEREGNSIVRIMNKVIRTESKVGEETTFYFIKASWIQEEITII